MTEEAAGAYCQARTTTNLAVLHHYCHYWVRVTSSAGPVMAEAADQGWGAGKAATQTFAGQRLCEEVGEAVLLFQQQESWRWVSEQQTVPTSH
jgi:hypothetical protein